MNKLINLNIDNKGITDYENDRSLSHPGAVEHSGWDFTTEVMGNFCNFFQEFFRMYNIPRPATVVEFGCGSGVFSTCLSPKDVYVGFDGNPRAGVYVGDVDKNNHQFICADLTQPITLNEELKADLFMSWDFFEHLSVNNIPAVVDNINNLLKDGGLFLSLIDTIILPEHISNFPLSYWRAKFLDLTNWELVEGCWRAENSHCALWQLMEKYYPPFWEYNKNEQMLLVYRKKG